MKTFRCKYCSEMLFDETGTNIFVCKGCKVTYDTSTENSSIDHPSHYQGNKMEVIEVIEAFECGFCLGNALKYILRAGKKGPKKEDLQKAIWYLQREIEKEKENANNI